MTLADVRDPEPFKGLRVLLEGNYRLERHGTGISQYSRTLASGLEALGCDVRWLAGMPAGAADSVIDQVQHADSPPQSHGPRRYLQTALRMCGGILQRQIAARRLSDDGIVIPEPSASRVHQTYLAPDLFAKAHYRHMLLRDFTEIRLPDAIDVFHLTAPLPLRMRGVPTVTTIHDLVPIRLPYTTPDNKKEFVHRVRRCAELSDVIITVSEASKRDIVKILNVDPAKVAVTYQPTDIQPLGNSEQEHVERSLRKYGLRPDSYVLFVGALEPKKNLRRLIEAFLEIETDFPLVIVGRRAWLWEDDQAWLATLSPSALARIRFLGYVSRDDLQKLYGGARLFAFPSLYEGFGLPVLEAMTMGCAIVTSGVSSLPEICGDAALYADPLDRDSIREKIEQLLNDDALRSHLSNAATAQARKFSVSACIERLGDAYRNLV